MLKSEHNPVQILTAGSCRQWFAKLLIRRGTIILKINKDYFYYYSPALAINDCNQESIVLFRIFLVTHTICSDMLSPWGRGKSSIN